MTQNTNNNTQQVPTFKNYPYFDDYDLDKNFYRILFKPGLSVQTRELNQLQSILQQQVGNLADYALSDKSAVVGGEIKFNQELEYIKLAADTELSRSPREYSAGATFEMANGITGEINFVMPADEKGPVTLYVRYLTAAKADGQHRPKTGDQLSIVFPDGNSETVVVSNSVTFTGKGTVAELIQDSIFYIKKTLVRVPKQALIIERYNNVTTESLNVGVLINEKIITSNEDGSLYDNALGTPNEMAPGADRYQITGVLIEKKNVPVELLDNFIEISRLEYSKESLLLNKPKTEPIIDAATGDPVTSPEQKPIPVIGVEAIKPIVSAVDPFIPKLQQKLAQRTYEESGDYITDFFDLDIREHLKRDGNNGLFEFNEGGEESLLVAQLDPGTAYIRGHRVSFDYTTHKNIRKGRDTKTIDGSSSIVAHNNYIIISQPVSGSVSVSDLIELRNSSSAVIGKAFVSSVIPLESGRIKLNIVLYETNGTLDTDSVKKIASGPDTQGLVPINAVVERINISMADNTLIDALPYGYAKSTQPVNLQLYKHFKVSTTSGGSITLSNEDESEKFSPNAGDYFIYVKSKGSGSPVAVTELRNGETQAVLNVSTINSQAVAGGLEAIVVAKITSERPRYKTKSLKRKTDTISMSSAVNGTVTLSEADGYKLISVKQGTALTAPVITSKFNFDSGQRDSHYDSASISVKPGISVPNDAQLAITYEYFSHSADGDYFSVDSYSELEYAKIPTYLNSAGRGMFLGAMYDFRPVIKSGVVQRNLSRGANNHSFVALDERLVSNITYYLPRKDRIMVTSNGELVVVEGKPDFNPLLPKELDDALTIYNLSITPYTFTINDVITEKLNHRRYTMRDIGVIEQRLKTVEEVALLNKLESDTASTNFDDRFKSGYVVDNFSTSGTGDIQSPHWGVAYDIADPSIRPKSVSDFIELGLESKSSQNVKYHEETGVITLDYTVKEFITQDLASDIVLVQPYLVHGWGEAKLTIKPSIDIWKESYTHSSNVYTSHVNVLDDIIVKTSTTVKDAHAVSTANAMTISKSQFV